MAIEFLLDRFEQTKDAQALIWRDRSLLYSEPSRLVKFWQERLHEELIPKSAVVTLEADFSPNAVALLLALLQHNCIVAVLTAEMKTSRAELRQIKVRLKTDESLRDFRVRLRAFCQDKLESYKIPVRVTLVQERLHSDRFKKSR